MGGASGSGSPFCRAPARALVAARAAQHGAGGPPPPPTLPY